MCLIAYVSLTPTAAGVSALLWLEGAAVTTLPNTRWTVLATNRLYAGGQPQSSGLVSGGFVGDLGDVALYGQAMTPDEMQHASAGVCVHADLSSHFRTSVE